MSYSQTSGQDDRVIGGAFSDKGMRRSNNEDYFCALMGPYALPGLDAVLAVADGMGGHKAGEIASVTAILDLVNRLRYAPSTSNTSISAMVNIGRLAVLARMLMSAFSSHQPTIRTCTLSTAWSVDDSCLIRIACPFTILP